MTFRRLLLIAGTLLILFLGMFTWNQRTRALDDFAGMLELEVTGTVLSFVHAVESGISETWDHYFDLVGVREENQRLKARLEELEARMMAAGEDLAELRRLRKLLELPVDEAWKPVGARVLAGRMGPNGLLDSITINRGYSTGGRPGTPVVTQLGLVGRVLRASPHSATVLLLTDPGSRIAVFSQEGRVSGILAGQGVHQHLEVRFAQLGTPVSPGEVLVTSGLDGKYPKGIPVARVISAEPSNYNQFLTIKAQPLVDLRNLEEVLLLESTGIVRPNLPSGPPPEFVGPPLPATAQPLP